MCGVSPNVPFARPHPAQNDHLNVFYPRHQTVKMAERLCAGRVVSVIERHCVAATPDNGTVADTQKQAVETKATGTPARTAAAAGVSGSGPTDETGGGGSNGRVENGGSSGGGCEGEEDDGKKEESENKGVTPRAQQDQHDNTGGGGGRRGDTPVHAQKKPSSLSSSSPRSSSSSELECLKGHIRGLRAGCTWFGEERGLGNG